MPAPRSGPAAEPEPRTGRHTAAVVRRLPWQAWHARHAKADPLRRALVAGAVALLLGVSLAGAYGFQWARTDGRTSFIGVALNGPVPQNTESRHPLPAAPRPGASRHQSGGASRGSARPAPSGSASPSGPAGLLPGVLSVEQQAYQLTNTQRLVAGCPALRWEPKLAKAARAHSQDMAAQGYFDHNAPDGTDPWTRIKAEGYTLPSAENIAAGQGSAVDVVTSWMNSSEHRANILNCSSKAIGIGFYQGGSYGYYWTADFGYQ